MREVGTIKWFGGYNSKKGRDNDFGFINRPGHADGLFVHRNKLRCSETALTEGTAVTFQVAVNPRNGKEEAVEVRLLADENDPELLRRCAESPDRAFWMPTIARYVASLSEDDAARIVAERLSTIPTWEQQRIAAALPSELFETRRNLWQYLPKAKHLALCLKLLPPDSSQFPDYESVKEVTQLLCDMRGEGVTCAEVAHLYHPYPDLRSQLPLSLHASLLAEWISNEVPEDGRDVLISELVSRLAAHSAGSGTSRERERVMVGLPRELLSISPALRAFLPKAEHLALCVSLLSRIRDQVSPRELVEEITTLLTDTYKLDTPFDNPFADGDDDGATSQSSDAILVTIRQVAQAYRAHPDLRRRLPLALHVAILADWIASAEPGQEHANLVQELASRLAAHQASAAARNETEEERVWDAVPSTLMVESAIWPLVPRNRRLPILLDSVEQVWPTLIQSGGGSQWHRLSREAKVLCIFRAAKETQAIHAPSPADEPDLLVRGALMLLEARDAPQKRMSAFSQAHTCFQAYVVAQAWTSPLPLDLFPLLPHCRPKVVRYCEGRPWATKEDKEAGSVRASRAFCPRKNGECELFEMQTANQCHAYLWGARLYPEQDQAWHDWSLVELLQACGVTPHLDELKNSDEYVTRLAGWVNRLNEIRERLRCSVCREMMVPNYEYSKNLARYNTTIVSCQRGAGHDQNIYLNHCWACRKIIDSRVDRVQKEVVEDGERSRRYLCVACGSGPQRSNTYAQGDTCPKCGIEPMLMRLVDDREQRCRSCGHTIRLPADQYRTGPPCQQCHTRMVLVLTRQDNSVRICSRCSGRANQLSSFRPSKRRQSFA